MSDFVASGSGGMSADAEVVSPAPPPNDANFVATFPEFNDASRYPAPQRSLWLNTAIATLDPSRWGDFYVIGVYLWTAHHLALFGDTNRQRQRPGRPPLLMSSKSVGGVSASYDTASVARVDAGLWNATTYGMRWLDLARLAGAGGVQVGYGPIPEGFGSLGYSGPIPFGGEDIV